MMKRLFAVLFTAFVTAGCCLPCYASEDPACEKAEYVTGDVFARYVREIPWEEAPAEDGIAVILTDDGYEITVEDIPDGAAGLRVFPVPSSETSGRGWIAGCIGEKYEIQDILDIYFADINGDRINADGVTVLIEKTAEAVPCWPSAQMESLKYWDKQTRTEQSGLLQMKTVIMYW